MFIAENTQQTTWESGIKRNKKYIYKKLCLTLHHVPLAVLAGLSKKGNRDYGINIQYTSNPVLTVVSICVRATKDIHTAQQATVIFTT